jgi:hypothetical protein
MQLAAMQAPRAIETGPVNDAVTLSVVLASGDRASLAANLRRYRPALDALGLAYEVLCVVEASAEATLVELAALAREWPELEIFSRRPWTGEDAEFGTAFKRARGDLILTLPPWLEIAPGEIARLFERIEEGDMVIANRDVQPIGGLQQRLLKRAFRTIFGHTVSDVFSRVRLSRRAVLEEVGGFGVRQHFIPAIAAERGYRVVEVDVDAETEAAAAAPFVFRPAGRVRALFDAMTLFVVLKFLRRPLRFFGSIGLPVLAVGAVLTLALVVGRLFFGLPLADRPALIFAVLMVVLGIQIIAIGLVGEIIIFANSRHMKQYKVGTIIRRDPGSTHVQEIAHVDD